MKKKLIFICLFLIIPFKAFALIEVDITRGNLNPLPLAVSPLSIDENSKITDDTRLLRAVDTIKFIKEKKCKILLISHFGRPKDYFEKKYSFQNLIEQFSKISTLLI